MPVQYGHDFFELASPIFTGGIRKVTALTEYRSRGDEESSYWL